MLFNSYIFIFAFLPITLLGYYSINRLGKFDLAKLFLCLMSLLFYGYFNVSYLSIIGWSLVANYVISLLFEKLKGKIWQRSLLILGLLFNLGILGYYKYYDFFVANINAIFGSDYNLKHILLPLGISFFTFQQLSFVIDRYKKAAKHYSLVDYVSFVTFFPQLVAGPIVLHDELIPQFQDENRKKFNLELFGDGICIFVVGLAMKVLIADNLGLVADYSFNNIECLDSFTAFLGTVTYALELYFDFAGYSNMAIGIGKMFGIELPDNFNRPFHCVNNKDTWKCWHITLSRFFRTYVYFPLGGSKKGLPRAIVNTMIVFLLSGLWHGADWTFVIWGVMHGIGICINMIWHRCTKSVRDKWIIFKSKIVKVICIAGNFVFFSLSMIFFRSNNMQDAASYIRRLVSGTNYYYFRVTSMEIKYPEIYPILKILNMKLGNNICYVYTGLYMALIICAIYLSQLRPIRERLAQNIQKSWKYAIWIGLLFIWCVISFSGVSQFLYFNF